MDPLDSKSSPRWTHRSTLLAVAGLLAVFALPIPFTLGHPQASSEYGALLQGIAGTLALALLLLTLHLQRQDLALQREELRLTREKMQTNNEEQKRQREQMEGQLAVMKQQADNATRSLSASIDPLVMPRFEFNPSAPSVELGVENVGNGKALLESVAIFLPKGDVDPAGVTDSGVDGFALLARHFSQAIATRTPIRPGKCLMPGERAWLVGYDMDPNHLRHVGRAEWEGFLAYLRNVEVVLEWSNIIGEELDGTELSFFPK